MKMEACEIESKLLIFLLFCQMSAGIRTTPRTWFTLWLSIGARAHLRTCKSECQWWTVFEKYLKSGKSWRPFWNKKPIPSTLLSGIPIITEWNAKSYSRAILTQKTKFCGRASRASANRCFIAKVGIWRFFVPASGFKFPKSGNGSASTGWKPEPS